MGTPRPSSGMSIAADTPFPTEALRDLRRALQAVPHDQPQCVAAAAIVLTISTLLTNARAGASIRELGEALRIAIEVRALGFGDAVDHAADAVRDALGVAGATAKDPPGAVSSKPTPYTATSTPPTRK